MVPAFPLCRGDSNAYPAHSAVAALQNSNRAFYAFGPLYPLLIRIAHDVTGRS